MSESIRIKASPGSSEKSVNIEINQKFDFIEILSLKISQDKAYNRFCSDYGVAVGRVIVNNGLGVPNAKVSIFIPLDQEDLEDPEISGLYPFKVISSKDSEGIPYNLLPRNNRGKDECFTPVGTLPTKREVQDNPLIGELHCKYYKFTTTTNDSGDFMFFGLPVGTHFMHVNADISDIGFLSQKPYDLISHGAKKQDFKSTTKFKGRKDSVNLTQLKTISPISVTVPPFWGDTTQCQIGIARSDIDLNTDLKPSAIFMGSLISDNEKHALSRQCIPRKKLGKMDELVTGDGTIEMIRKRLDDTVETFNVEEGDLIDENGTWAYQIPMNRDYITTAEDGTLIPSGSSLEGIPTTAKVRFRIGMNESGDEGKLRTRAKFLVPHNPDNWTDTQESGTAGTPGYIPFKKGVDFSFDNSTHDDHFAKLEWNTIYTIKNHITRVQARGGVENRNFIGFKNVDDSKNRNPIPFNRLDNDINPLFSILCVIFKIIARLVGMLNKILIPIINTVLIAVNAILALICTIIKGIGSALCPLIHVFKVGGAKDRAIAKCAKAYCIGSNSKTISKIGDCNCGEVVPYVPYILLSCKEEKFAPGGIDDVSFLSNKNPGLDPYYKAYQATKRLKEPDAPAGTQPVEQTFSYANNNAPNKGFPGDYMRGGIKGAVQNLFFPNDGCNIVQRGTIEGCDAGWSKCQAISLAEALDVFKLDFYNDWLNGALYPFLLRYKVKKKGAGKEKFCEVDCDDFFDGSETGGVDNDKNGKPDNRCKNNYILDTCTDAIPQGKGGVTLDIPALLLALRPAGSTDTTINFDKGVNNYRRKHTRSGYIKKYKDELYYSPVTASFTTSSVPIISPTSGLPIPPRLSHKLFATDIVSLGPVFRCDWKGRPQLFKYLTETSFNIPSLQGEPRLNSNGDRIGVSVSGYDTGDNKGNLYDAVALIGNISCGGLDTDSNSCNNVKRLCELGVGLDREIEDDTGATPTFTEPDNKISNQEVEGGVIRGIFTRLNDSTFPITSPLTSVLIDSNDFLTTSFSPAPDPNGYPISGIYSTGIAIPLNGYQDQYYSKFRVKKTTTTGGVTYKGINPDNTEFWMKSIWVFDNSYYFYFGLNKGSTALNKLNNKYFTKCTPEEDIDFFIIATNINPDLSLPPLPGALPIAEGAIDIEIVGGVGPYIYVWSGPNINGVNYPINNSQQNVDGLYGGTYSVTVLDSAGNTTNATFNVPGPTSVICNVQSTDVTTPSGVDGKITVDVIDGTPPYTISLHESDNLDTKGLLIETITNVTTGGHTFDKSGAWDGTEGYYYIEATDSGLPETKCSETVLISEPNLLVVTLTPKQPTCPNGDDGEIIATVTGGQGPYTQKWSSTTHPTTFGIGGDPNNPFTSTIVGTLKKGNYEVEVTDLLGQKVSDSVNIENPNGPIIYDSITTTNGNCNSSIASATITNIQGGIFPYTVKLSNSVDSYEELSVNAGDNVMFNNGGSGLPQATKNNSAPYILEITDSDGCTNPFLVTDEIEIFNPLTKLTSIISGPTNINETESPTPGTKVTKTFSVNIDGGIYNTTAGITTPYKYKIKVERRLIGTSTFTTFKPLQTIPSNTYSFTDDFPIDAATTLSIEYKVTVEDKNGDSDGCTHESTITTNLIVTP